MLVRTVPVTAFQQNARVLIDPASATAVIVDPGGDVASLLAAVDLGISGKALSVTAIALTHAHLDHAGGVASLLSLLEQRGARPELLGHRADRLLRESIERQAVMFGLPAEEFKNSPEPDRFLEQDDAIAVGETVGRVLFTPGHAPGHISFYFPAGDHTLELFDGGRGRIVAQERTNQALLIAGDTLFAGSIGRTDLPGGDHATLLRSIEQQIFTLPETTIVMPGHGEDTTVGRERCSNPFFAGCA